MSVRARFVVNQITRSTGYVWDAQKQQNVSKDAKMSLLAHAEHLKGAHV